MAGLGRPSVQNNHAGCVFPIAWPVTRAMDEGQRENKQMQTELTADQAAALIRRRATLATMIETAQGKFARAIRLGHRKAALRYMDRVEALQIEHDGVYG
jgi:hypothetical protein